jgi:serine/threonine protein kinase
MEYVAGVTLRDMIAGGKLTAAAALAMTPQICEALEYAHGEGVVHRDIKPENILVDDRGRLLLADFGLAKLSGHTADRATLTQPRQAMGTLHYMAPEQMHGLPEVDHRADIYSLGVVIYEMLTGELPIGRFEPPSHRVAVDVRIDEVVLRTLERDPDRRYQQAAQLKTELDAICRSPGAAPKPDDSRAPSRADPWSRATLAVCGLILLASLLPWGLSAQRSKLDYDLQFSLDQQGHTGGESIYRRAGPVELGFLPEGKGCNAWNSSLGLRIIPPGGRLGESWPVQLPNWIVPVLAAVIGLLFGYRYAGHSAPAYSIPLLAAAGLVQMVTVLLALVHRGRGEAAPYLAAIGFAWCFVVCLTPAVVNRWRRVGQKV